ncbi:YolD-like family protein [Halobacillus sp. A5]|uniref:YolD-like family protein n=1 Tax=Halobacillus sp. A5 TaxID=2880263 RepID=UPI0020A6BD10|nr:YolD-like family protein [Halobacillus sp. A5]MCP3027532.1 YolD-like family protein [Halobacillus sp. A5]
MDHRDRGTIKWTSLMLPEHVEMIKKVWKEDERVEKGILDEQKAAEIDFVLQRAVHDQLTVDLKFHNSFDYETRRLKIESVNKRERKIKAWDVDEKDMVLFSLEEITDITIV